MKHCQGQSHPHIWGYWHGTFKLLFWKMDARKRTLGKPNVSVKKSIIVFKIVPKMWSYYVCNLYLSHGEMLLPKHRHLKQHKLCQDACWIGTIGSLLSHWFKTTYVEDVDSMDTCFGASLLCNDSSIITRTWNRWHVRSSAKNIFLSLLFVSHSIIRHIGRSSWTS